MLSNLEQALITIINTKQELTYKNVLSVYCNIPGVASGFSDHDPAVYFHHSLDKYADADDKRNSPYAKYIRLIRAQYWGIVIDLTEMVLGTSCPFPCPCKCGVWDTGEGIRRKLGVIVDQGQVKKSKRHSTVGSESEVEIPDVQKAKIRSRRSKKRCSRKCIENADKGAGPSRKRFPQFDTHNH